MDREHDTADLIDLGQASIETQGIVGRETDVGFQLKPLGISDE